jgi:hypothetical protein
MPKVSIIILNWNGLNDTIECLDSVYRLEYPNFEVVVVDNCSTDGSVGNISREFPQAFLIENSKNLGFTGGNNVGMKYAMRVGADYVWLLNNDTVVEPHTLAKLVEEAEQSPQTGLVSPVIYCYDCHEKVQFMGAYVDFTNFNVTKVKDSKELEIQLIQRNLILWGTALLIKRKVIETVGYLSEKYFAYVEDCDYSFRAMKANYRASVRLDAHIFHKGSQSTGRHSPIQVFLGTRNLYFLWSDNTQGFRRILLPGYYIGMVINYVNCLSDEGNEEGCEACLNGFWAAFRGKGGGYDPTIVIPVWLKITFCFFVSWYPHFWVRLLRFDVIGIVRAALAKAQIKFQ